MIVNLLFCILFATANNNVITGKVYDSYSKEPLPMVNILLEGSGIGTVTDINGYYVLEIPDTLFEFNLVYSMIGYRQVKKRIKFVGKDRIIVNIAMHMEALKVQGIIVSAKKERFKKSASITPTSISQKELRILPSLIEGDLMRTLAALPGVTKSSDFSTDISVRGGGPDQNQVLIDDVPILNPSHLFGLVSAFNVNAIRNAELYVSGIPVKHDASLSSVLDIKTRGVGREIKGFTGVVSLSPLSSGLTLGSPISSLNSNYLFSVRRTYIDKLLSLFKVDLPYYFYDGYLHIETDVKNWSVILSGYMGKDFLDIRDEDNPSIKIVGFDWGNKVIALNLFHSSGEDALFHISTGWSTHDFSFRILDTLFVTNGLIHLGTFGADYWRIFKGHKITVGFNENYRPFEYNVNFQMGYSYTYDDIWSNRTSVYIEDKFSPLKNLLISGGVALIYYYSESKEFELSNSNYFRAYRFATKYFIDDLRALTLSFGNFHQYVIPGGSVTGENSFPVYYWIPLGGEYDPEKAHHLNVGCEGWLTEEFYFALEGYYRKYSHLLQMRDMSDIEINTEEEYYRTMLEAGFGKSYGIDFLLKKEIGKVRGWISYTFLKTDVTFSDLTYPTIWDRRHNLHLILLATLPKRWETGTQLTFSTGNPYTSDRARFRYRNGTIPYYDDDPFWTELEGEKNQVRYPPYLRFDISASKAFYFGNNEFDLKVSIFNVLNRKNVFLYYYDYDEEPPLKKPFHMLPIIPSIEIIYRF
ncbi:hypothetical protein ES703_13640 [subsurface metagenome]